MKLPAITLLLLLAQNAGPQLPVAPAAIEGAAVKAGTGESLAKVTVTLIEVRSGASGNNAIQERGISPYPDISSLILLPSPNVAPLAGLARGSVATSADGKFLFENLKPGSYQITANSPGYVPMEYGQRGPNGHGINFTLKAGQKMQNVALTLTPEGSITGRVVDSNGDPLSRVLVQAQKVVYQERGRSLKTVQAVPSDDRGDYRLFWLPPGKYYISATPFDERARTMPVLIDDSTSSPLSQIVTTAAGVFNLSANIIRDFSIAPTPGVVPGVKVTSTTQSNGEIIEEAAVPVYYPSAFETANATLVEVRAGDITSGVNITTMTTRVFRIHGTMVDAATGRLGAVGTISLLPRNGPFAAQPVSVQQSVNRPDFEIAGVIPGSYYLYGFSTASAGAAGLGSTMVDVSSTNIDNVVIPVSQPTVLSGRIVVEGALANTNPAPGARTSLTVLFNSLSGLPSSSASMEPDGKFTVVGLLPGDYRVLLRAGPGIVPKSILYDGKDVQTEGLHIGSAATGSLEIVVTTKAGRLEGNVIVDRQQHVPNATVVLMPISSLRQQSNLYQTVQSNAEGHYVIDNIAPGAYKLFAWDDVPERAWFDTEFMRDFESQGREITIRESAMETLDIPVIPR